MWYGGYSCVHCGMWITEGTSHMCALPRVQTDPNDLRMAAAFERIAYALENLVTIMTNEEADA